MSEGNKYPQVLIHKRKGDLSSNVDLEVENQGIYQLIHLGRLHLSILNLSWNWSIVDLFPSVPERSRSSKAESHSTKVAVRLMCCCWRLGKGGGLWKDTYIET